MKCKSLLFFMLGVLFLLQAGGVAWSQVTARVSVDSAGAQVDDPSYSPSISSDGRYVAFESISPDLVVGDSNGKVDIFVHDRDADGNGTYDEPGPVGVSTVRVSVATLGGEGSDHSHFPSISSDGRYVAFESNANDLVAVDINPLSDMFVHDLLGGTTTLVSVDSAGDQDLIPSSSSSPSLTSDGRYVAFQSDADLVASDSNGTVDIFVHDRDADGNGTYDEPGGISTVRVSVDSAGVEVDDPSYSPSISSDGRYVAFESISPDLVAGDGNGFSDVFVHDRDTDGNGTYDEPGPVGISTVRVSVDSAGNEANGASSSSSISSDGRYVAFVSDAPDLVAGDTNGKTDVFVHDRDADNDGIYDEAGWVSTVRVSVNSAGAQVDDPSYSPSISGDGRYVTFESISPDLVAGDTNGKVDIFVHDRDADGNGTYDEPGGISTVRVSVKLNGDEGDKDSNAPSISSDGSSVAFASDATNLVGNDTNGKVDIFVDDLQPGAGGDGSDGDGNSGGGCFISTAAQESRMAEAVK